MLQSGVTDCKMVVVDNTEIVIFQLYNNRPNEQNQN